jgi:hypothetical protein
VTGRWSPFTCLPGRGGVVVDHVGGGRSGTAADHRSPEGDQGAAGAAGVPRLSAAVRPFT